MYRVGVWAAAAAQTFLRAASRLVSRSSTETSRATPGRQASQARTRRASGDDSGVASPAWPRPRHAMSRILTCSTTTGSQHAPTNRVEADAGDDPELVQRIATKIDEQQPGQRLGDCCRGGEDVVSNHHRSQRRRKRQDRLAVGHDEKQGDARYRCQAGWRRRRDAEISERDRDPRGQAFSVSPGRPSPQRWRPSSARLSVTGRNDRPIVPAQSCSSQ